MMDPMELVTLGVAVLSLVTAVYAVVASWRQADHTQRAADEAESATEIAGEALSVAKRAHDLETTRLQAELTPQLRLDPVAKGWAKVHDLWLTNGGPVRYERLDVKVRPSSLVGGLAAGEGPTTYLTSAVQIGPLNVGDKQVVSLHRSDPRDTGTVWLEVEASRADGTWQVVLPVDLGRPAEFWSI